MPSPVKPKGTKKELGQQVIEKHGKCLKELTVQSKILEAAELENSNQVWKRILLLPGPAVFLGPGPPNM